MWSGSYTFIVEFIVLTDYASTLKYPVLEHRHKVLLKYSGDYKTCSPFVLIRVTPEPNSNINKFDSNIGSSEDTKRKN